MTKCIFDPPFDDCNECELINKPCHPFTIQLEKEKKYKRGAHSALERKELDILKLRTRAVKALEDDVYDLFCKWVEDDPDVPTVSLMKALENYKTKYNRMVVSQERVGVHQKKQEIED